MHLEKQKSSEYAMIRDDFKLNVSSLLLTSDNISEFHHIVYFSPAVLANPVVAAGAVGSEFGRNNIVVAIMRGSNPVILIGTIDNVLLPIVGRHDSCEAVGPG